MKLGKRKEQYVKPEQVKFLEDLEKELGRPLLKEGYYIGGRFVKIEEGDIVKLNLVYFRLSSLPESIGSLTSLKHLYLRKSILNSLPESIGSLTSLMQLDLSYNLLTTLPESIGSLTSLTWLNLRDNKLTILPESFGNLKNLLNLDLGVNFNLTTLPKSFTNLKALKYLDLTFTPITSIKKFRIDFEFVFNYLKENGSLDFVLKGPTKNSYIIYGGISLSVIILGILLLIVSAIFSFRNLVLTIWATILISLGIVWLIGAYAFYARDFPRWTVMRGDLD